MRYTLFFLFLLFSTSAIAQYTSIPDINFEKSLISLGIDSGVPDGKVLTSSISSLKTLNISKESDFSNRIKDLTGIQNFVALENLNCSYNELTNIDLSKNLALTVLYCSNNFLLNLDVSKNISLSLFNCDVNKLITLDVSNNINLVHFFCEFNNLKSLDVTNNVKLMVFYTGYNQLTSLDVSKNNNLNLFHCSFNKLTSLDLSKNINLVELGCIYNLLTDLDLSKNTKLTFLHCTNNLLTNLNLKNGNNINLRYNSIISYNPNSDFKNNPNLACISVDDVAYSNANWSTLKDATASYTTTENPAPEIPSPQSFCIANNQSFLDLTITSGTNLTWYSSPTGGSSLLNTTLLIDGTTYYASQNSGGCESSRTPVKVFIGDSQVPIPTLSTLPTITGDCNTQITTIPTATDTCAGAITATTASPLSYSLPGNYTIVWKYDDGNGNSVTQNQTLIISSQPIPSATSPQTFCIQQNITLNSIAITGQNIKWYDALTNGNLLTNTTLLLNGTTYYASQSITGCESERIPVKVIVEDNLKPVPNIITLPTITGDCNTQITTTPIATDACAGTIMATTTSPLSYSLSGTYVIVWNYNDGNGNTVSQNQTVIISSQPLPTATSQQTFCIQQNATLNSIAITGQNIKWYDALTNGNLLANTSLLQDGKTYFASQTINGCESERIPVLINIQNTAIPSAISPQTFCASQNPTLNTLLITGTNVKWYDNSNAGSILSDTTPLQNGITYYATQILNGCESPTRIGVTIELISTLPANNYSALFCDDLNDGTETVDLNNYNSSIISNTTNYNFTYYSSLSGAENETASSKITNFKSHKLVLGDNKIFVRINSNTPCYAVAELKLTLLSKPAITIDDIVPICESNSVTIDAGAGFDHYLWSNGEITQTITVSNPGDFSVTVTNDYATISCSSTKNFTVKESSKASIKSIETLDWTDTENTISVIATGKGVYEYSIDGSNYQDSNVFPGLVSGKYIIHVRDKNNCGIIKTDEIYLLMFPKFFTPNGDGFNDTWKIKFADVEEGLTVKIFDRYGKLIKMLSNVTDSWNGTFNGAELPATDYWFVVTRANGTEDKGHFSLKR